MSKYVATKKYDLEFSQIPPALKKAFPDYPCIDCDDENEYRCNKTCQVYKEWRKAAWEEVTSKLKRSPE